jgi:FG-GAP-like repeat/FG-GAP repeat
LPRKIEKLHFSTMKSDHYISILWSLIATFVSLLLAANIAFAQQPHRVLEGEQAGDFLGQDEIAFVGDLDGDGCDDLLTGMNDWQQGTLRHFRVYSGADGSMLREWIIGGPLGAQAWSCSPAGDVDGDGVPDVVLGGRDEAESSVRVMSGADGSEIWKWLPLSTGQLGREVRGGGDVDGDGVPDVIARENDASTGESNVYVYSGATGLIIHQFLNSTNWPSWHRSFGRSLEFAGDLNGDGCDEIIVGDRDSYTQGVKVGAATVFSGADGSELFVFPGSQVHGHFGDTVASPGDMNGDGVPEIAVGTPKYSGLADETGLVHVYSGLDGALLHEFEGAVSFGDFGFWIAAAGDVNGDSRGDLVVFGDLDVNGELMCRVYSGADGTVITTQSGSRTSGYGKAIAGAGDSNGDGWPDFAVSAPKADANTGSIFIYPGSPVLNVEPLIAGQNGRFEVEFFASASLTWLAYSTIGAGSFPLPQLGIDLDLASPALGAGPNLSDAAGAISWQVPLPAGSRGITLWLQAVQFGLKTNMLEVAVL